MISCATGNVARTVPFQNICSTEPGALPIPLLLGCWIFMLGGVLVAPAADCVGGAGSVDATWAPDPDSFAGAALSTVELSNNQIMVACPLLVRVNADGTPDPSFTFDDSDLYRVQAVHAFAVASNGTIAAATSGFGTSGFFYGHFHLLNHDGASLFATYTGGDSSHLIRAVACDAQGRILAGGNYVPFHEGMPAAMARLTATGALDSTFAPPTNFSFVVGIVVQPDGKLLVLESGVLYRLLANGSPDPAFSPAQFDTFFQDWYPHPQTPIVLQPDGRILVAGEFTQVNGLARRSVVRLNSNGVVDVTFDAGMGAAGGFLPGITLAGQADGKVLVGGGFTSFNGFERPGLVRLRRDGSVDSTFDAGHQFYYDYVRSITVLGDGRLLVTDYVDSFGGSMSPHKLLGDPAIHISPPTVLSSNRVVVEFSSVSNATYVLQQSSSLQTWQSLSTNTAMNCLHRFTNAAGAGNGFFRVLRQN